ncbi:MAG: tRNA (adenosine(37)-N6)-dimethylallyltransferase MiaA, partial [Candidatus Cloacimonadota bacterium]
NKNLTAFQAPGYREFIQCLKGTISEKDATSKTKVKTRNYAKRQFTWFRKLKEITWFDVSDGYRNCVKNISDLIVRTGW